MTDREFLAAEHALGLLEGEAAARATALCASDAAFADEVARWEAHFAPLFDETSARTPGDEVWARIERELAAEEPATNVVTLRRRMRMWQATAGLAAAAAVILALFAFNPAPPASRQSAPVLAGSIPIGETPLRLALTYLPDRHELLVSASGITGDGAHDHELWLVPPEGDPLSLGVVRPGAERRVPLDPSLAARMRAGATLALTREPIGGKPAGRAAGPIVGVGTLAKI